MSYYSHYTPSQLLSLLEEQRVILHATQNLHKQHKYQEAALRVQELTIEIGRRVARGEMSAEGVGDE
jgi:hypothetical protein